MSQTTYPEDLEAGDKITFHVTLDDGREGEMSGTVTEVEDEIYPRTFVETDDGVDVWLRTYDDEVHTDEVKIGDRDGTFGDVTEITVDGDEDEDEDEEVAWDDLESCVEEVHECEECGRDDFASERGVSVHQAHAHTDDEEDDDDEPGSESESNGGECPECGKPYARSQMAGGATQYIHSEDADGVVTDACYSANYSDKSCATCGGEADTVNTATKKPICESCASDGVETVIADGGRVGWSQEDGWPEGVSTGNIFRSVEEGDEIGVLVLTESDPLRMTVTVTRIEESAVSRVLYGKEWTGRYSERNEVRLWTDGAPDERVAYIVRSGIVDPEWPAERDLDAYALPVVSVALSPRDDLDNDLLTWMLSRGASWAEAGDYLKTQRRVGGKMTTADWGERRGVSQQAVSKNVSGARSAIEGALPEDVKKFPTGIPSREDVEIE